MPAVRGSYFMDPVLDQRGQRVSDDARQWVLEQRANFDFTEAARECGVAADDIAARYEDLAYRVERLDPLQQWRDLVNQVERSKVDQLRGEALCAQDLYDASEVLRRWYRELTQRDLRHEWDAKTTFGPDRRTRNQQRYGYPEIDGNRAALPGILDHFRLYPWKVTLITEGPGDVAMLEAIVAFHTGGATFERLGIVPHVMKGSPRKKDQRVLELIAALRRFPNYFLLVFDNEGTAPTWAKRLEDYRPSHAPFANVPVLEPEPESTDEDAPPEGWSDGGYVPKRRPEVEIWRKDIEADNFGESEIADVISDLAKRDDRVRHFDLTGEEIADALSDGAQGVATVAIALAEQRGFPLQKPDLDAALGRYAARNPQLDGTTRRVMIVAEHLYRLTVAHRVMRGRLREGERQSLGAKKKSPDGESA
jgi:hypothetical protein